MDQRVKRKILYNFVPVHSLQKKVEGDKKILVSIILIGTSNRAGRGGIYLIVEERNHLRLRGKSFRSIYRRFPPRGRSPFREIASLFRSSPRRVSGRTCRVRVRVVGSFNLREPRGFLRRTGSLRELGHHATMSRREHDESARPE